MDIDLKKVKKVFFIGIGGIGISALAQMMISRGIEVAGVNDEESPKTLGLLRNAGANIFFQNENEDMGALPEADLYIYSDTWLYRGEGIVKDAKESGKPTLSYFEALGAIAKEYKVVAVAGTHGKTTTTAMLAEVMVDAGLDPTVIVGSIVKKFGSNFRKGGSDPRQGGASYLVVEADEYNRHFLNFHPLVSVVTNIEADHLDCYKDLTDIKNAFKKFLAQSENKIVDYEKYLEKVPKLSVPGEHNRANAAAAFAVADFLNIDIGIIEKSLAEFSGTWRRLERRGVSDSGTIIYDDYAHHPTEIRASLEALRELYPRADGTDEQETKKITLVFQPHLYSRTKALFADFVKSFNGADRILLLPIYFAREEKDDSVSSDILAKAISDAGSEAKSFSDFKSAEEYVKNLKLGPKDVLVTMGAGEAYKVADQVFKDILKSG